MTDHSSSNEVQSRPTETLNSGDVALLNGEWRMVIKVEKAEGIVATYATEHNGSAVTFLGRGNTVKVKASLVRE